MSALGLSCLWRSGSYGMNDIAMAAAELAGRLTWGQVIALQAPMGTGKTTLVAALARHFKAEDAASSPTFALCQSYPISGDERRVIRHLDLYRIRHSDELLDLGWDELMEDEDALTFVEWPEKAADHFPQTALLLRIEKLPDGKRMAALWQRDSD
jgi:tRNA threonylcarbamoyladenosine biosynthesis protein TsaE